MKKTIIVISGRSNEGKSETIKNICKNLLQNFPNAISTIPLKNINFNDDILLAITINGIKIGLESQGDPKSRIIHQNTLEKLADSTIDPTLGACDIIVCATRTRGETVHVAEDVANKYDYHTIWLSSYWSPNLAYKVLNDIASKSIVEIITSLMLSRLS